MKTIADVPDFLIGIKRVSTPGQAKEDKAGLLRQEDDIKRIAAQYNKRILRIVEVIDVSGSDVLALGVFDEVFRDLERPDVAGVAVPEISRLIRPDYLGDLRIFDYFSDTGTCIYTPGEVIDPSTQTGFMMGGVRGIFAGLEKQFIRDRFAGTKDAKRRRQEYAGPLPAGVKYDKKKKEWSWKEPEVSLMKEAYRRLLAGDSVLAISAMLGCAPWTAKKRLINPVWKSVRRFDEGRKGKKVRSKNNTMYRNRGPRKEVIEYRIPLEPIISDADWDRAQSILAERSHEWNRGFDKRADHSALFLAPKIMRCGCGAKMYYHASGRLKYYWCSVRYRKGKSSPCAQPLINREVLDSAILRMILERILSPDYLLEVLSEMERQGKKKPAAKSAVSVKAALKELDAQRDRLLDLYQDGKIAKGKLEERLKAIEEKEAALSVPEPKAVFLYPAAETAKKIVYAMRSFHRWPLGKQREFLEQAVKAIICDGPNLTSITISGGFIGSLGVTKMSRHCRTANNFGDNLPDLTIPLNPPFRIAA